MNLESTSNTKKYDPVIVSLISESSKLLATIFFEGFQFNFILLSDDESIINIINITVLEGTYSKD